MRFTASCGSVIFVMSITSSHSCIAQQKENGTRDCHGWPNVIASNVFGPMAEAWADAMLRPFAQSFQKILDGRE